MQKMKTHVPILACFMFLASTIPLQAQKHCPVNFDGITLQKAIQEPDAWFGKIMAINGRIKQVASGYLGKPYFLIEVEKGGELWISGQVKDKSVAEGTHVRLMGYFEKTVRQYMPPKVNRDGYHLIAFVVYDLDQGMMAMRPGQEALVQEWLDGKIPNPGKRSWQ